MFLEESTVRDRDGGQEKSGEWPLSFEALSVRCARACSGLRVLYSVRK